MKKKKASKRAKPNAPNRKTSFVTDNHFKRVSYTEAIDILKNSKPNKKKIQVYN
jgi:asparaginyl-tRNA synthetase